MKEQCQQKHIKKELFKDLPNIKQTKCDQDQEGTRTLHKEDESRKNDDNIIEETMFWLEENVFKNTVNTYQAK